MGWTTISWSEAEVGGVREDIQLPLSPFVRPLAWPLVPLEWPLAWLSTSGVGHMIVDGGCEMEEERRKGG